MKKTFETTFVNRFNGEAVVKRTTITDSEEPRDHQKKALAIMYNRKKLERKYPRTAVIDGKLVCLWKESTTEVRHEKNH